MFIESLVLENFKCFGPGRTTIELGPDLTAFIGTNGSGKTAAAPRPGFTGTAPENSRPASRTLSHGSANSTDAPAGCFACSLPCPIAAGDRAQWDTVTMAENGGSKPVLQPDPDLYPDLVAAGSLAAAVIQAAEREGLDLDVRRPVEGRERLICASILTPRGRFGISIGAVERWFITSLWWRGVELTRGSTKDLGDVVGAAAMWASGASLSELCTAWPHLHLWELAQAHERGDAVAFSWQLLRQHPAASVRLLVETAYAQPRLRVLFPFTSHHDLHFSRCTGFPYSWDVPFIQHLPGGRYLVSGPPRQSCR